jgi:hypothetical protein
MRLSVDDYVAMSPKEQEAALWEMAHSRKTTKPNPKAALRRPFLATLLSFVHFRRASR